MFGKKKAPEPAKAKAESKETKKDKDTSGAKKVTSKNNSTIVVGSAPKSNNDTSSSDSASKDGKPSRPPSIHEIQEQRRAERQQKLADAREKMNEQLRLKKEREAKHREALKARQFKSMVTFVIGLFVMLTALICLFPTPMMIVFSTLLMFSFFFLGIAYQRMVMQLLVIAMACVVITGAFYFIISSTF